MPAKKSSKKIFTPKKLPTDTDVIMPGRKYPKTLLDAVKKAKRTRSKSKRL